MFSVYVNAGGHVPRYSCGGQGMTLPPQVFFFFFEIVDASVVLRAAGWPTDFPLIDLSLHGRTGFQRQPLGLDFQLGSRN